MKNAMFHGTYFPYVKCCMILSYENVPLYLPSWFDIIQVGENYFTRVIDPFRSNFEAYQHGVLVGMQMVPCVILQQRSARYQNSGGAYLWHLKNTIQHCRTEGWFLYNTMLEF